MLRDFVHTEKHPSEIFKEIIIKDAEIRNACLNHHNGTTTENKLLPLIRYYDGLASYITRKKPFKTLTRYDYQNGKIAFKQLAEEIEKRQDSAYKLTITSTTQKN